MIRSSLGALALFATVTTAASAQSQQEVDARYDRALAAGYKALFLCSAIANAERVGEERTVDSIVAMELTGIYPTLDPIVRQLPHEIVRTTNGVVEHVSVKWADDMQPRIARYRAGQGCAIMPPGHAAGVTESGLPPGVRDSVAVWNLRTDTAVRDEIEAAFADQYGDGTRTTAVIVRQGGELLDWRFAEGYSPFMPQRTWSVAKSIAATLVGAAVQRGSVDVQASAGIGASETDPRRAITIDHLLRMASGRYSDTPGNRTDPIYWGGATVGERAATWPLIHEPGTVYRYANNDTLMAIKAIAGTFEDHPPANFFDGIGMHNTVAETDWQGNYILSSQVWASANDLVELGQLYLDDGILPNGERILPEGWLEYVSTPSGPQPEGRGIGYGAGFWLFNRSEGIPPDTIAARGNRGQYVVIVPSRDVVIVRRGEDPAGKRFDIVSFTRDILGALDSE